ncbi:hypothetical protein QFZ21_001838 [Microbacterium sp. W4I20]|nr:hypothetical protein [Microbacterium sp. W4I20]
MTWTAGVVRQGISGDPTRHRTTPELCPWFFHPPVTYNPQMNRTWCLCGAKTYPGDCTTETHLACCDGALTEITPEYIEWDQKRQETS